MDLVHPKVRVRKKRDLSRGGGAARVAKDHRTNGDQGLEFDNPVSASFDGSISPAHGDGPMFETE